MKRFIVFAVVMLLMVPVFAGFTGKDQAISSGLFEAVNQNYSLFGGITEDGCDFGFRTQSDTSFAHPVKWNIEGAMFAFGTLFIKLPADVNTLDVVVVKESATASGITFTNLKSYSLSDDILMMFLEDEHDEIMILRPGAKYAGLRLAHVHEHGAE